MIWLNGEFRDDADAQLSWSDPGFVSGATVVDNCRTWGGKLFRWDDHHERFRDHCHSCFISLPYSAEEFRSAADGLLASATEDVHVITFATPETVGMHLKTVNHSRNQRFYRDGIRLVTAGFQPQDHLAILAPQVKQRSRMHWYIAEQLARQVHPEAMAVIRDAVDGVFTETAIGNLVGVVDNTIVYPPSIRCLNGIGLRVLLEFCAVRKLKLEARDIHFNDLPRYSELMLVGSGFGVASIRQVDDLAIAGPGPFTQMLMTDWAMATGVDLKSSPATAPCQFG